MEKAPIDSMTDPSISFKGISKRFDKLWALRDVSADLFPGEMVMLIGPNASGKSTLIRSLLGLVRPTKGSIVVNGKTIGRDPEHRRSIGYMPQISQFPTHLTVGQLLDMMRDVRGDTEAGTDDRIADELGLRPHYDKALGTLSGGTRQKVSAVLAFRSHPKIVVMDEPTAGLDPLSARRVLEHAASIRDDGGTVMVTSHLMEEVASFADRVAYLEDGTLRFLLPLKEILEIAGTNNIVQAIPELLQRQRSQNSIEQ